MNKTKHQTQRFVDEVASYVQADLASSTKLPKVQSLFRALKDADQKDHAALVTSAVALTPEEKRTLTGALEKWAGRSIALSFTTDASLVAGMKIQIGDWIMDTSFHHQLEGMADTLTL